MLLAAFYGGWVSAVSSGVVLVLARLFWPSQLTTFPQSIAVIFLVIVLSLLLSSFIQKKKIQWAAMVLSTMILVPPILSYTSGRTEWFFWVWYDTAFLVGGILAYQLAESLRNAQATTLKLQHSQEQLEETVNHWQAATEQLESYITEKKIMEEKLRKSEAQYRLIAEHSSDLIAMLSVEGDTLYISPSHLSILGLTQEEFLGKNVVPFIHPEDTQRVVQLWRESLSRKISSGLEYRFLHKEGHYVWLESNYVPILTASGEVEKFVVISRDVTERKETENLLRNSEKLSVVGELAAGIAHEIRNPLTTLKGFMQLMKTEENYPYYIDVMYGELERMEGITNEFLCLAKPQISEIREIQIWMLLEQVSTLLYPQALLNRIELVVESEPNMPVVTCVENQIKQVFINLVKNAIEAMEHGGEIRLAVQRENDRNLLITVHDQGTGIPADKIKKLGQPFYSLKEKGTGLGLTVCQKIIREHRGRIDFRSEMGKGTTVEVRLPYRRDDQ